MSRLSGAFLIVAGVGMAAHAMHWTVDTEATARRTPPADAAPAVEPAQQKVPAPVQVQTTVEAAPILPASKDAASAVPSQPAATLEATARRAPPADAPPTVEPAQQKGPAPVQVQTALEAAPILPARKDAASAVPSAPAATAQAGHQNDRHTTTHRCTKGDSRPHCRLHDRAAGPREVDQGTAGPIEARRLLPGSYRRRVDARGTQLHESFHGARKCHSACRSAGLYLVGNGAESRGCGLRPRVSGRRGSRPGRALFADGSRCSRVEETHNQ